MVSVLVGILCSTLVAEDWPGYRGRKGHGLWREENTLDRFGPEGPPVLWRAAIGPGYTGPTVAEGRVYAMDADSGRLLWEHRYPSDYGNVGYDLGPRASVAVADGRAFAMGTMGHFHCLNAETGEVIWTRDLVAEYDVPMITWGLSATPLIVGEKVIHQVGGADGACVMAFNAADGKELWRAVTDRPSYSSPVLTRQAEKDIVLAWTQSKLSALDPKTGKVLWSEPFRLTRNRPKMNCCSPALGDNVVVLTTQFDGIQAIGLDDDELSAETMWRRFSPRAKPPVALHDVMSTPIVKDGYIYGVDTYGQFRCLRLSDGKAIWEDLSLVPRGKWATIHMVEQGEKVWMFTEAGELILAELSPEGCKQISRAKVIEPTSNAGRRKVAWSHPAFADGSMFVRNDKELIRLDLRKQP
jgi:outer membrane protein assembly factor BamB